MKKLSSYPQIYLYVISNYDQFISSIKINIIEKINQYIKIELVFY